MSFHNPIQQFWKTTVFQIINYSFWILQNNQRALVAFIPATVFQERMSQPLIHSRCECVLQLQRPPEAGVHQASTARPGKRANAFFTPQGASCLAETDRGRRLSSPLTAVADGCHNTQYRVNDGHQTGLIWAARKDEGSWGREERVGVYWHFLWCFLSLTRVCKHTFKL